MSLIGSLPTPPAATGLPPSTGALAFLANDGSFLEAMLRRQAAEDTARAAAAETERKAAEEHARRVAEENERGRKAVQSKMRFGGGPAPSRKPAALKAAFCGSGDSSDEESGRPKGRRAAGRTAAFASASSASQAFVLGTASGREGDDVAVAMEPQMTPELEATIRQTAEWMMSNPDRAGQMVEASRGDARFVFLWADSKTSPSARQFAKVLAELRTAEEVRRVCSGAGVPGSVTNRTAAASVGIAGYYGPAAGTGAGAGASGARRNGGGPNVNIATATAEAALRAARLGAIPAPGHRPTAGNGAAAAAAMAVAMATAATAPPAATTSSFGDGGRETGKRVRRSRWDHRDTAPPPSATPTQFPVAAQAVEAQSEPVFGSSSEVGNRNGGSGGGQGGRGRGDGRLALPETVDADAEAQLRQQHDLQKMERKIREAKGLKAVADLTETAPEQVRELYEERLASYDEETGATYEHRKRAREMARTAEGALATTLHSQGRHVSSYLPRDELNRIVADTVGAAGGGGGESYAANKLAEDNIGFQMLRKAGWEEGEGLGREGGGVAAPVSVAAADDRGGVGAAGAETAIVKDEDAFEEYRKRMMLNYRFRPNELNNPRRSYY